MSDPSRPPLPSHLDALVAEDPDGRLREELERAAGRPVEAIATGRLGRAMRLGSLAVSGGARLAVGKARQLLGGEGPALSREGGLALASQMLATFSELRGVAMKVGQMLSYVDDGLPPEVQRLLAVLQRDAPVLPPDTVRQVLREELGRDPSQVFAEWDDRPLAAASIGQVHRARLGDGTRVAVKVQVPGIDRAMRADIQNGRVGALLHRVLLVRADVEGVLEELEERLLDECDYRKELGYQQAFHRRFEGHPTIVVPRVFPEASARRVLTTELHEGRTYQQWLSADPSREERDRAVRALYRFYLGSFYLDGLFNCDPHPGNYLFRDDGRIVFLDYGCCRPFADERRRAWIAMALAVREDTPEGIERAAREIGFIPPSVKEFDRASFRELMRHLYEPYLVDAEYDFALHRPAKTFRSMFTHNPNLLRMDMPRDAVFLNRITFGLVSLMAEIGVPHNTYRVANAYFDRSDPDWPQDPWLQAPGSGMSAESDGPPGKGA